MAWEVKLTAQANQDVTDILAWTEDNFGVKQANIYSETLSLAFEALSETGLDVPDVKERTDIGVGIHVLHVARQRRKGRHFIVFTVNSPQIIHVLRVLHDSMDLPKHLPKKLLLLGDALSELSRKYGLTNEDFETFEHIRDNPPAGAMEPE